MTYSLKDSSGLKKVAFPETPKMIVLFRPFWMLSAGALVVLTVCSIGCGGSDDKAASEVGKKFMMAEAPADPATLEEAKEQLTNGDAEVTLVGRIAAGEQSAFADQMAAFILTEAPEGNHEMDPDHNPDDCPFCKRRAQNSTIAFVSFDDDAGKPIQTDARDLFGLTEGHIVVVTGNGKYDAAEDRIRLHATGLKILNDKQKAN